MLGYLLFGIVCLAVALISAGLTAWIMVRWVMPWLFVEFIKHCVKGYHPK